MRNPLRFQIAVAIGLFLGSSIGCTQNAFKEFAKTDSDAALLFEARKEMNGSRWDEAIALMDRMSSTARADRSTKATMASAYAGRCGLNLIRLADQIANSSGQNFFPLLLQSFQGSSAASVADCQQAESILLSIATDPAARTADENVMMAFIDFSKIGAILSAYADADGNGTADPTFDSCDTAQLPDNMLREVGTGMTLAVSALAASGGSIGSALAASVTAACSSLASIDPSFDFCTITTPSGFSASQVKALGGLVKSTDDPGLGTCAGGIAACVCP